ncbi:MAG: cytochrome c-type biogenesis protein CcmH [Thermoflexus hugenholtzii]|uniref:cytochrome c-type biogenesis protein n=1 Tax=Thermoflexus TaxID=1495649 RepID=UPI001C77647C|nr:MULTISPECIES: cytochrome c-type biogenesis protein CcmH [Thermoflexus]QWK10979.1 MAG: cytochrome c-type biogenesis protein CcmH [Thermoflexus hugenholtzii]
MRKSAYLQGPRPLGFALGAIFLVWALAVARPAGAQTPVPPVPDDEVNRVARQLYCPVCENVPLDVCDTPTCIQWKEEIRSMLAAGRSETEIVDFFVSRYGMRVLAVPPPRGIGLGVWLIPALGLPAAGLWLASRLARWRRPAPAPEVPPEAGSDEAARALDRWVRENW